MKKLWIACLLVAACDGGSNSDDAGTTVADTGVKDSTTQDTGANKDSGAQDSGSDAITMKDTGSDTGIVTDGGPSDTGVDTGVDAGFSLNGCTDNSFIDLSQGNQATRTVNWDLNQNFPYCFIIDQGQSFVWNVPQVTFASHPLEPAGGDQNNPIQVTNSGNTVTFQFANKGNFGFDCQFHPGQMRGVIRVK